MKFSRTPTNFKFSTELSTSISEMIPQFWRFLHIFDRISVAASSNSVFVYIDIQNKQKPFFTVKKEIEGKS